MVTFSVVICTRNRSSSVARAIKSVQGQTYPASLFEIIVIDNASADDTRAVVEKLDRCGSHSVKYFHEPKKGLSRARNLGAVRSANEVVAYMDDDAEAESDWLLALSGAYSLNGRSAKCVGGGVELFWDCEKSAWFPPELESYLSSSTHLGNEDRMLLDNEYPIGTNFSVDRHTLLDHGLWNETFMRYSDEVELTRRLRQSNLEIRYAPSALVLHHITPNRVSFSSLLGRAFWQGISDVALEQSVEPRTRFQLLVSTLILIPSTLQDSAAAVWYGFARQTQPAFLNLFRLAGRWGRAIAQVGMLIPPISRAKVN